MKKGSKEGLAGAIGVLLAMNLFSSLIYKHIALGAPRRAAHEDEIREAIFRYEMKAHHGTAESIFFLSINNQDPSDAFMRRFSDVSAKKWSDIAPPTKPPQRWISDRETGKPGVALSVGKITWTSHHGVIVAGGYYCGSLCAGSGDFYVNFKDGRWVVEKFDIKVIS